MRHQLMAVAALVAAMALSACDKSATGDASIKIALVTKATSGYWKAMQAGALQAGKDSGVEVILKAPATENDRAQQIEIVNALVGDNISAIVLAPINEQALVKPVEAAGLRRIPVVIVDSPLNSVGLMNHVSFIATDNLKGGDLAGQELSTLLGGKGKVILFRYLAGTSAINQREEGFLSAMRAHSEIQATVENHYAGTTVAEAESSATRLMDQIKQSDGIFCPNDISTEGMLQALKNAGWTGHVKIIGFDATPALLDALKSGQLAAVVSQDPYKMGYDGVKAAVSAVHGQTVQPVLDTGVRLITREDLNNPEMQKFLSQ